MDDIIEEASALVECKGCPWYKSCAMPMRFTAEDLSREMERAMPGMTLERSLLASMAAATQNMVVEACPIFVSRLKASPKLAERIKQLMQSWGTE